MANVIRQAVGEMVLRYFPWAFMLMGLVVVGYCTQEIVCGWQSSGWPVTEGRVEVCAVEVANGETGNEASYAVKVRYVFSVDGREYRSDRISFGMPVFNSQEEAITAAALYPVERTVKVHYHSKTPELCVLMPGSHGTVWIGFVVGIVFFLMGVGIFFLLRIVKNKPGAKGIGMVPKPQSPPWEHRRWHGGVAREDYAWVQFVVPLIIGGAFLGVATAIAISMGKRILHEEWSVGLFLLVFMASGIGALICAFISLARWWRFGGARVRMTTLPGVIGGHFSGEVELLISVWTDLAKDLHVPKDGLEVLGLLLPLGLLAIPTLISVVCFALGSFLSMVSIGSFISRRTWVERGMIRQTRTFMGIPLLPRSVTPASGVGGLPTIHRNRPQPLRENGVGLRDQEDEGGFHSLQTLRGVATVFAECVLDFLHIHNSQFPDSVVRPECDEKIPDEDELHLSSGFIRLEVVSYLGWTIGKLIK